MKGIIYSAIVLSLLSSCKPTLYVGNYGQVNQTQVVLSNSSFKVLGSFTGVATYKKKVVSVKQKEGIIAAAKANLLENAKAAGIELVGSRALVNITVDVIQNPRRVTATVSAEIIEFTK